MYADSLKKLDNVKMTAVWDEDALRGKKVGKRIKCGQGN